MHFKGLLQKDGWHGGADVTTDDSGIIVSIAEADADGGDFVLPGFRNAHSHAFQYAMAGVAENHSNPNDDFWSWREAMYKLALEIDPDQLEATAAMLYSEMIRHGYTHVAEFQYLHHDKDGTPYSNPAEMASRLIAAASKTGINITVVPVFYKTGGFGKPATEEQRRFVFDNTEDYLRLVEATARECGNYEYANFGIGIHSLRAASADEIVAISKEGPGDVPLHIHVAEQLREVEDCVAFYGKRPVEWLLDNAALDERWNLVHATYLLEHELTGITDSGANVVLCPTTECNLGDGIFSLKHFRAHGGSWSIGSDSNVNLNPFEEIRLLDYGQRLTSRSRNTFGETGSRYAIESVFDAGGRATGVSGDNFFEVGKPFNGCVVGSDHPLVSETSMSNRLNTIVYCSDPTLQRGSIVNGRASVAGELNNEIGDRFAKVLRELGNR